MPVSKTGDSSSGMETGSIKAHMPAVGTLLDEGFIYLPQVRREVKNVFVVQNEQMIGALIQSLARLKAYVSMDPGAARQYNEVLKLTAALLGSNQGVRVGQ